MASTGIARRWKKDSDGSYSYWPPPSGLGDDVCSSGRGGEGSADAATNPNCGAVEK